MVLHFNPPIALSELDLSLNLWNFDFGKMGKSCMKGDFHVQFCEKLKVQISLPIRLLS